MKSLHFFLPAIRPMCAFCVYLLLLCIDVSFTLRAQGIANAVKTNAVKTNAAKISAVKTGVLLPNTEEFRLKNGVRILLIEDPTQERIVLRAQFAGGTTLADAVGKEGIGALFLQTLASEVQSRANGVIPAHVLHNSDSSRIVVVPLASADALSLLVSVPEQHLQATLEIIGKVLMLPPMLSSNVKAAFQQVRIAEQARKSASLRRLALEAMTAKIVYGKEHPYSRTVSETSLQDLSVSDVQTAYAAVCLPNNTLLAITGNIRKKNLLPLLTKTFGAWKSGDAPYIPRPRPMPMENGVYLVESPAVPTDSALWIAMAFDAPERNDIDYEALSLTVQVLQNRLQSRLKSTALAFGSLTENKYANCFLVQAMVAHPSLSPDSTILRLVSLMRENIKRLYTETPNAIEIAAAKNLLMERYTKVLRQSDEYLGLLLRADAAGISHKEIRIYPKRLQALSPETVRIVAERYLQPARGVVVLADSADIAAILPTVRRLGNVFRYTPTGEPIVSMDKSDISLDSLISLHTAALGGTSATARIATLSTTTEIQLSAMAQKFPGTILTKQKIPNKIARKLEITATQISQELWCDGTVAVDKIEMMGQEQPLARRSEKETESALFDAQIFPVLTMHVCGFVPELLGKRDGNYVVKATAKNGTVKTLTFDGGTYLLSAIEEMRQTPQGIVQAVQEFREYAVFEGVQLPTIVVLKTGPGTLIGKNTYEINQPIGDEVFQVRK